MFSMAAGSLGAGWSPVEGQLHSWRGLDGSGGIRFEGLPLGGGGGLLRRDAGHRSSLGFRLRISITLWESSACESPGSGYGCAGVLGPSV